jgi:ABC-type transport system substrate-binding protein
VAQVSGFSIMGSIFDGLVERDYNGSLVPVLAQSWSLPDPNTIEF